MGEFRESDAGVSYTGGDLGEHVIEVDQQAAQAQRTATLQDRITTKYLSRGAPTPPPDAGPTISRERTIHETVPIASLAREEALAEYDRLHAAWGKDRALGDDRTPEGQAFLARLEALILRGKGLTPEQNHKIGEAYGWRLRSPDSEPDDAYIERADVGVMAARSLQDVVMSTARTLGEGAVTAYRDFLTEAAGLHASGPPPDDIELHRQLTAKWSTPAQRQAIDARLSDLQAAVDRLLATAGCGGRDRQAVAAQLVAIEDRGVAGIEYLLRLERSLFDRVPAFADAYAAVQSEAYEREEAAKARAAVQPAEDGNRPLGAFGRP